MMDERAVTPRRAKGKPGAATDASEGRRIRKNRYRSGLWSETIASAALIAKRYRILERRFSCSSGEIDLIAVRGKRLAFIEVKRRATLEAAQASITDAQRTRIADAADIWLSRHGQYHGHDISFDVVFVLPWRWPVHLKNAL